MHFMLSEGSGRAAFVRFWRLLATAVKEHPSAVAAELLNEPNTMRRRQLFQVSSSASLTLGQLENNGTC